MTARKKAPEALIAERETRHAELAKERDAARKAVEAAHAILGMYERGPNTVGLGTLHEPPEGTLTIPERQRRAEEAVDLERDHEPFEEILAAEAEAHRAIRDNARKVVSKSGSMETLTREIADLRVEHRGHFIACAEEGSTGAEAQLDRLLAEFDTTVELLKGAWGRWSEVGIPVSTNDLAHVRHELEEVRRECCWPRRSEAAYRGQPKTSLSVSEAREPLIELIG